MKLERNIFERLLNSKKLFGNKGYWNKMETSDRKSLVEVFTAVCFEEVKKDFIKWTTKQYETVDLARKVLQIIKDNHLQRVYSGSAGQNRLVDSIDKALTTEYIIEKICHILDQVRYFFEFSSSKVTVSQIARDLLIGHKTTTVIIPEIKDNDGSDNFEIDTIYKIFISKILKEIRNNLKYPRVISPKLVVIIQQL